MEPLSVLGIVLFVLWAILAVFIVGAVFFLFCIASDWLDQDYFYPIEAFSLLTLYGSLITGGSLVWFLYYLPEYGSVSYLFLGILFLLCSLLFVIATGVLRNARFCWNKPGFTVFHAACFFAINFFSVFWLMDIKGYNLFLVPTWLFLSIWLNRKVFSLSESFVR